MRSSNILTHILLLFCLSNFLAVKSQIVQVTHSQDSNDLQNYIVHVEKLLGSDHQDLECWHKSFLPHTTLDSGKPRLVYSYQHAIGGFAARLTRDELKAMEAMGGFLHAEPDGALPLATTYTPAFLGLSQPDGAWSRNRGNGIIIGVLDTGILPTHVSFHDAGMPPPPAKWKGACGFINFTCNNIIGGAAFNGQQIVSPEDDQGHGSHVASIVAGNIVSGANFKGGANRIASGVAPKAHLAIYKVCFKVTRCRYSDILAGIDRAIGDGVDVITMSLGGKENVKFNFDAVALGSLSAVRRGIIAVASAGNKGRRGASTLSHGAPWVLTVGATTTDRRVNKSTTKFGYRPAPELASFSSRGPSWANGGILKPDVLAPGVQILGASPFAAGTDPAGSAFVFMKGTSMAAPHVTGAIALVKKMHPSWSPAAIQSAIVTTAHQEDLDGNTIVDHKTLKAANIFDMGAGQVDPTAALNPGLVYDLNPDDYVGYLCGLGYTDREVTIAFNRRIQCSSVLKLPPWQLNYPSIGVTFGPGFTTAVVERTVTNVGPPNSVYTARVTVESRVQMQLDQQVIRFVEGGPIKSIYRVQITLSASGLTETTSFRGKLEWVSENHVVTSPVAILYDPSTGFQHLIVSLCGFISSVAICAYYCKSSCTRKPS